MVKLRLLNYLGSLNFNLFKFHYQRTKGFTSHGPSTIKEIEKITIERIIFMVLKRK